MSRAIVAHTQPTIQLSLTINVNADRTLLLIAGLVWLSWLTLARLGRWVRHAYEIARVAVVVAWRRARRAWGRVERRIEWQLGGLVYGPVCGVG